jgi:hypothetical protein
MCIKRVVRLSIRKSIGGKVYGKDWKQRRVVPQAPGQIYSGTLERRIKILSFNICLLFTYLHLGRRGSNNAIELLPPRAPFQSRMALCLLVSASRVEEATVSGTTDHRQWLYK